MSVRYSIIICVHTAHNSTTGGGRRVSRVWELLSVLTFCFFGINKSCLYKQEGLQRLTTLSLLIGGTSLQERPA